MNVELHKELNKSAKTSAIICVVLGAIVTAIGLAIFIADLVQMILAYEESTDMELLVLIVGLGSLTIGISLLVGQSRTYKELEKNCKVEEMEFFQTHFTDNEFVNGENVATVKIYYGWIIRVRETANYIFMYNTRVTAYAIDKRTVSFDELAIIRGLLSNRQALQQPAQWQQPVVPQQPMQQQWQQPVQPAQPAQPVAPQQPQQSAQPPVYGENPALHKEEQASAPEEPFAEFNTTSQEPPKGE